jgi:hypothetical protein
VQTRNGSKVVIVNRDNDKQNGSVDYAESLTTSGSAGSLGTSVDEDLAPITVQFSKPFNSPTFKFSFGYSGLNAGGIETTTTEVDAYDGETYTKTRHTVGEGLFRILLRKDGESPRYIEPNELIAGEILQGTEGDAPRLYVEAINGAAVPQSIRLTVWKDDDKHVVSDLIQVLPLDPIVGVSSELEIAGYTVISDGSSGTSGNDLILGTAAADTLIAGAGDDIVIAGAGDDQIDLGAGTDIVFGFHGQKHIAADDSDTISYIDGNVFTPSTTTLAMYDSTQVLAADAGASQEVRPFNAQDIEAAYKWMFGEDVWYKAFKSFSGTVHAVEADGRNFSNNSWNLIYRPGAVFELAVNADIKIEYDIGNVMDAAQAMRTHILEMAGHHKIKHLFEDYFASVLTSARVDKTTFDEALLGWQDLRERAAAYAVEIGTLAANLNPFFAVGGAGASAVQAIFDAPDLLAAGGSLLSDLFKLIPLIPGDTSDWEDDGEAPGAAALQVDTGFTPAAMQASATGRFLYRMAVKAAGADLFDVSKDLIRPAGAKVNFVYRRDLINGNTVVMPVRPWLANNKVTMILGVGQNTKGTTHAATMEKKAAELAATGLYSHITLARNWRTATGRIGGYKTVGTDGKVLQSRIPDIIAVGWDGKVVPFEVMSPSDERDKLVARMREAMNTLPVGNQTVVGLGNVLQPLPE